MTKPSSCSGSSTATNCLSNRLNTIFKKAFEFSILCETEVCVIYYGPGGESKTWPNEKEKVKDMALKYKEDNKRKKSLNLHEFLDKEKGKNLMKKKKKKSVNEFKYPDWYPIFHSYSPEQLSQLIHSLEMILFTLQEKLRFAKAQNTNSLQRLYQTKPLNPRHATLSQLPLSASHYNQLTNYQNLHYSALQEPFLKNHFMMQMQQQQQQHSSGYGACLSNIVPDEFYSNFQKNPYGDMVGSTSFSPDFPDMCSGYCGCLSNIVPNEFYSNFQKNPYGDMVSSTSFSPEFPDMSSGYGKSSLLSDNFSSIS